MTAVEITKLTNPKIFIANNKSVARYPVIASSDAHCMDNFVNGPKTVFTLKYPSLQEICQAFGNQEARGWFIQY